MDENDSEPNYNIFIANADGTDIDTVTTDHVHDNIHPTFLSGGAEVAFTSYYPVYDEDPFATFANIAFKIYRNSAAGAFARNNSAVGALSLGSWEVEFASHGINEAQQLSGPKEPFEDPDPPPTATPTPPPPFTITTEIMSNDGQEMNVIPYQEAIFTITITNDTDTDIEDLVVEISPFTTDANPSAVTFRVINRLNNSFPLLIQSTETPSAHTNPLHVDSHEQLILKFTGHSKRSGTPVITIHATSDEKDIDFQSQQPVHIDVTRLDLSGNNPNALDYSAMMFWAIFNETSEGNMFAYDPDNLSSCFESGWDVPNDTSDVIWVVRNDHPELDPRCHDLLYMDAEAMLNGLLSAERHLGNPYVHFTVNYKGSLGNQPSQRDAYDNGTTDPYTGTYKLWMVHPECWPLASDFGITDINNGPAGFPSDRIGYKVVLDRDQTIATLPEHFDRQAAVVQWLSAYLNCTMDFDSGGNTRQAWRYSFYQRVYLNEDSIIKTVFSDLQINCPAMVDPTLDPNNPGSYLSCDPANGRTGRVSALARGTGANIVTSVDNCTNANAPQDLISDPNMLTSFQSSLHQELGAIGSPAYSNEFPPDGYKPAYPAILLPILFFSRDLNNSAYSVLECHWEVISYSGADTVYNYPR